VATEHHPVGIRWEEKMSGFHSPLPQPPTDEDDTVYEVAEAVGREQMNVVSVKLIATVRDVARVVRAEKHPVQMAGTATVAWRAFSGPQEFEVTGILELPDAAGEVPPEGRLMKLSLRSKSGDLELSGYKRLRNDPGPDAWRDTSTLFLTLHLPHGERSYGVIRLSLDEFLFSQLPTFEVTNTDDPARIAWALSSFGTYFFGVLAGIYLPQLDKVVGKLSELGNR